MPWERLDDQRERHCARVDQVGAGRRHLERTARWQGHIHHVCRQELHAHQFIDGRQQCVQGSEGTLFNVQAGDGGQVDAVVVDGRAADAGGIQRRVQHQAGVAVVSRAGVHGRHIDHEVIGIDGGLGVVRQMLVHNGEELGFDIGYGHVGKEKVKELCKERQTIDATFLNVWCECDRE